MKKRWKKATIWILAMAMIAGILLSNTRISEAAQLEENAGESISEEGAGGSEELVVSEPDSDEEASKEPEDKEESEIEETKETEEIEVAEAAVAEETEKTGEEELLANSWRYSGGQPVGMMRAAARAASNAWQKVNGRYISSDGSVIEGAQLKGIDVSEWQGKINWEQVKADGIEFAIIRCGYGRDTASYDDDWWEYNVSECERLGIPYGVYLYSYATGVSYAQSEADHVLRLLKGHHPSYPVYYDLEDETVLNTGNDTIGKMAQAFCSKVSAAGYRVGIYANLNWWNNYLTSSVFNNSSWSKWVAQYNNKCTYAGTYDAWQCTSSGSVKGIPGNTDLNFWMVKTYDQDPIEVEDKNIINYSSHIETYGWQNTVLNGYQSGVTGYSKRMEAVKISVGEGYGDLGVKYSTHVQSYGWQDYVTSGQIAGTTGESKRIEAIKIELTGNQAANYDIYYRVHSQSYGWLDWAKNGEAAGTQGYAKRLEAIQIVVVKKGSVAPGDIREPFVKKPMAVSYQTYVNGSGWQSTASDGVISGTEGQAKILEGLKVKIADADYDGNVTYDTYMQSYGWTGEKSDMTAAGLAGSGKRLEAVKIKLTGDLAEKYDIYYRVHCQSFGWLGWAKNGEIAGSMDYAKRLEAIQVKLVAKGGTAPGSTSDTCRKAKIKYRTHVQTYGWKDYGYDGDVNGTTGLAKRLEAIQISLPDSSMNKYLTYKTHVQTYGWQNWVTGGQVSGTTGLAKRLEAIQIKLTGEMADKYDVYYRVHSQTYGWLGWAKNGESAGTEGLAKRLEAIQIVLVEKGGAAPGDTTRPFIK